ncbi:Phox/Bem1p [Macleaya cordata]|uniref:Phox/Bem1p n=1 Tax=Macleaya cordata TaxID=56857 RepID=A0A200PPJ0_MACCD|nr:Phox/Bem1p [Macleaya cordata]
MAAIGGGGGGGGGEERIRVKFLCSHGGKILPRPADGKLKYVGGETRIVIVPRDINFSELINKLSSIFAGDTVLKYQLIPEDLDALVSVTNDDDLRYMLDEYDRQINSSENNGGIPRLRAFLFPSNPILIENQTAPNNAMDDYAIEQRYIDAINGVVRASTNIGRPIFGIASSCGSSPRSIGPDTYAPESINHDMFLPSGFRREMHRVHSSPSDLCNLGHHYRHHHQHPLEQQLQQPYMSSRFHGGGGSGRLASAGLSVGRSEIGRPQMGHIPTRYYSPSRVLNGGYIGCGHDGECTVFRSEGF